MRWIFSVENPVMQYVIKAFDCMCLSFLWMLFSVPVITAGASATALYACVYHYIRNEDGHLWRTFWGAFRENLKRSTVLWLLVILMAALLAVDVLVFRTMAINGDPLGRLYWVILLLCCVAITWVAFMFAYAARFQGRARDVLRVSFMLMAAHPFKAMCIFAIVAVGILLGFMAPGLLTILPALICLLVSMITENIFASHLNREDEQS
jgi:uncharacterized membrane protein YesL